MKEMQSFENLEVFRKAYKVSLEIHKKTLVFPKEEQYGLADQMRRASKSICANLAEGYAKRAASNAEFQRFLMMSVGSAEEMRVWIRYAFDLGYITDQDWQSWRSEYQDIAKMLNGLRRSQHSFNKK